MARRVKPEVVARFIGGGATVSFSQPGVPGITTAPAPATSTFAPTDDQREVLQLLVDALHEAEIEVEVPALEGGKAGKEKRPATEILLGPDAPASVTIEIRRADPGEVWVRAD